MLVQLRLQQRAAPVGGARRRRAVAVATTHRGRHCAGLCLASGGWSTVGVRTGRPAEMPPRASRPSHCCAAGSIDVLRLRTDCDLLQSIWQPARGASRTDFWATLPVQLACTAHAQRMQLLKICDTRSTLKKYARGVLWGALMWSCGVVWCDAQPLGFVCIAWKRPTDRGIILVVDRARPFVWRSPAVHTHETLGICEHIIL